VTNRTFKAHPTRIDEFPVCEGIDVTRWYTQAGLTRSFFNRIRAGDDFSIDTLLRLVRAARDLTGKDVRASELADLGNDAPMPSVAKRRRRRPARSVKYDTALERLLVNYQLTAAEVMREARLSKPTLLKMRQGRITRNGRVVISTATLMAVVRALRKLTGEPVCAADVSGIEELRD
jgi:predicted transcriptional regulator